MAASACSNGAAWSADGLPQPVRVQRLAPRRSQPFILLAVACVLVAAVAFPAMLSAAKRATHDASAVFGLLVLVNVLRPWSPRLQHGAHSSQDSFEICSRSAHENILLASGGRSSAPTRA